MQTEIKFWDTEDIGQIAKIELSVFREPWNERMLTEEYNNPAFSCLVAKNCGEVAGYIGFHTVSGEYHIANIAVKENYRRQGVAKALLTALITMAEGNNIRGITLEVRASNNAAISLYQSFGFKIEGIRKKYYGTEDGFVMWKYL